MPVARFPANLDRHGPDANRAKVSTMSVPVQCPHCYYPGKVAAALVGRRVRCPECEVPFLVEALVQAEPTPAPLPAFAFLDEEEDKLLNIEPDLAALVPRLDQMQAPILPQAVSPPIGDAPASSAALYVGMGIGIAGALSLSTAFALLFR